MSTTRGIAELANLPIDSLNAELDEIESRPGDDGDEILLASLGECSGTIGALANLNRH